MNRFFYLILLFLSCSTVVQAQFTNVKLGDIIDNNGVKAIVYKVNEEGNHGTMMTVDAYRPNAKWFKKKSYYDDLELSDRDNGKNNVKEICDYAKQHNINLADFPTVAWCIGLGEGWYIPGSNQVTEFIQYWDGGGSTQQMMLDWGEEEEEVESGTSPADHKKMINEKLIEAGGISVSVVMPMSLTKEYGDRIYFFKGVGVRAFFDF